MKRRTTFLFLGTVAVVLTLVACGGKKEERREETVIDIVPPGPPTPPYPISERGGTPATGPRDRFNSCERIWCLLHGENFFIDHFLEGHSGYVVHDNRLGDVFAPRHRTIGPDLSNIRRSALLLCGLHVHPWVFGKSGGTPVRHTGYNHTLGYGRDHFRIYGTRLDPCCVNGQGSAFVHSDLGKQFRFHDLEEFRSHPEMGWQKPFAARVKKPEL